MPVLLLPDAATINWDTSAGRIARVTIADDRALAKPVGLADGEGCLLAVSQDGAGGHNLTAGAGIAVAGAGRELPVDAAPHSTTLLGFLAIAGQLLFVGDGPGAAAAGIAGIVTGTGLKGGGASGTVHVDLDLPDPVRRDRWLRGDGAFSRFPSAAPWTGWWGAHGGANTLTTPTQWSAWGPGAEGALLDAGGVPVGLTAVNCGRLRLARTPLAQSLLGSGPDRTEDMLEIAPGAVLALSDAPGRTRHGTFTVSTARVVGQSLDLYGAYADGAGAALETDDDLQIAVAPHSVRLDAAAIASGVVAQQRLVEGAAAALLKTSLLAVIGATHLGSVTLDALGLAIEPSHMRRHTIAGLRWRPSLAAVGDVGSAGTWGIANAQIDIRPTAALLAELDQVLGVGLPRDAPEDGRRHRVLAGPRLRPLRLQAPREPVLPGRVRVRRGVVRRARAR